MHVLLLFTTTGTTDDNKKNNVMWTSFNYYGMVQCQSAGSKRGPQQHSPQRDTLKPEYINLLYCSRQIGLGCLKGG